MSKLESKKKIFSAAFSGTFCMIFMVTTFNVSAQFIPDQKEVDFSNRSRSTNKIIGWYSELSNVHQLLLSRREYCQNLVRNGAIEPSKNFFKLLNVTYPKILNDINECHIRNYAQPITKQLIKKYRDKNPSDSAEFTDMVKSLNDLNIFNSAPQKRQDLNNCQGDEYYLNLYINSFRSVSGYPDKNWCTNFINH